MITQNKIITLFTLLIFTLTFLSPLIAAPESESGGTIKWGVEEQYEVYGEEFVPDYSEVGYAGADEVHSLSKDQWKDVWERITKWKESHGGVWPAYVDISKYHVGIDKISKSRYLDMADRWDKWEKNHNGQEPDKIGIEGIANSQGNTNPSTAGSIQKKLMDAVGSFNTFIEFYNLCKGRKYSYYYEDIYGRDTAIKRLKNREGLNCVDVSQLGYALAKEMGYDVKFQESSCSKGGGSCSFKGKR